MNERTPDRIAEWADLVGAEVPDGLGDRESGPPEQPLNRAN